MLCCENGGWERVGCVLDVELLNSAGSSGLPDGSHLELEKSL